MQKVMTIIKIDIHLSPVNFAAGVCFQKVELRILELILNYLFLSEISVYHYHLKKQDYLQLGQSSPLDSFKIPTSFYKTQAVEEKNNSKFILQKCGKWQEHGTLHKTVIYNYRHLPLLFDGLSLYFFYMPNSFPHLGN